MVEAACENEPIHRPGSIQPHGFLLVIDPADQTILRVSENIGEILESQPDQLFEGRADDFMNLEQLQWCQVAQETLNAGPLYFPKLVTTRGPVPRTLDVLAHRNTEGLVLELEEPQVQDRPVPDALLIGRAAVELGKVHSVDAVCSSLVRQARHITGYDRALIYRFDPAWHGTVIAEDRNDVLPSYLGRRFPASDIPRQARQLYRVNPERLIPDASYVPVPVVTMDHPRTGSSMDMTFCALRSVSPVHLQYMRNMETAASFSVSLLIGGELWGLLSCHSRVAKSLSFASRAAMRLVTHMASLHISTSEAARAARTQADLHRAELQLLSRANAEPALRDGLADEPELLLGVAAATGAAIVEDSACTLVGVTPDESDVRAIATWLNSKPMEGGRYSTDALPDEMPAAETFKNTACGLVAAQLSPTHDNYVLWFRPETIETVDWSGDPHKAVYPAGSHDLSPRRSFEIWREIVAGRSIPWDPLALEAVSSLRSGLLETVLRRSEEREKARRMEDMARSNRELYEFASAVAHDLQAPLRHMRSFAELLRQREESNLSDRGKHYVKLIENAASTGQRIVSDMLASARLGQARMQRAPVDIAALVRHLCDQFADSAQEREIEWRIEPLVPAYGDQTLLGAAFQNLIDNALKFTATRSPAIIEVSCRTEAGRDVYVVRDNGVGFDSANHDALFRPFQRLHSSSEFEGTGLGLSNVRKIVERHNGQVWAESKPGEGAAFCFAIPKNGNGTANL